MGKLLNTVETTTQDVKSALYRQPDVQNVVNAYNEVSSFIGDAVTIASRAVVLSLSKVWIGIGVFKPATTEKETEDTTVFKGYVNRENPLAETGQIDRFDTTKMWSMQLGNYFLPLSQTYVAKASKRLNVSSLVDGIDIIQQTRKEAKTIECTLKISLNEQLTNLQLVQQDEEGVNKIGELGEFLSELYEKDIIFKVNNQTLNSTFGLEYVIMTNYKFSPRTGSKTYVFEFSLTEVKYGDNVLTFDERQIQQ